MQFTPQTITILQPGHIPAEIEAMVGENSGLAYYKTTDGKGIVVTTAKSGYYVAYTEYGDELPEMQSFLCEPIIQRFIEIIAPWLDWGKSMEEIIVQAQRITSQSAMQARLWQAFCEARAQIMTVDVSK